MCFKVVLAYEVLCYVSVQVRYSLDNNDNDDSNCDDDDNDNNIDDDDNKNNIIMKKQRQRVCWVEILVKNRSAIRNLYLQLQNVYNLIHRLNISK